MKLKLKEDPREWRKLTLLTVMPLAILSTLLCWWRHSISQTRWIESLVALGLIAINACVWPRLFRGYYRASTRFGFWLSQTIGLAVLAIFFFVVITPTGLLLRMLGKDSLKLKRPNNVTTYWNEAKPNESLDRMF